MSEMSTMTPEKLKHVMDMVNSCGVVNGDVIQALYNEVKSKNDRIKELESAIRNADDLSEIYKKIGPSEDEEIRAKERMARIDEIWDKYISTIFVTPENVRNEYRQLVKEQDRYEAKYF